MTTRLLLKGVSSELQSLGILKSPNQVLGFLKAWQDEDPEVIECLADCMSQHPDWLYGWLLIGSIEPNHCTNFNWLRFLMLENKPMLAVDKFTTFKDMAFGLEFVCGPA